MTSFVSEIEQEFYQRLSKHLKHYYVDTLGLKYLDKRIAYRATEEKIEQKRLEALLEHIGWVKPLDETRMLVVGSGWGGMVCAAQLMGINVSGLDVDPDEIHISKLRCLKNGLEVPDITECPAEEMPYADDAFDLVYCFSVVEHVNDVEKTIKQISRVLKTGGCGYIQTQNYNIPWEPHYKMVLPTFLGYGINKFMLKIRGRNPDYLDTINLIRKRKFLNLLEINSIPQVEEWDIVQHTIANQKIMQSKISHPCLLSYVRRFIDDPDRYIGELIFRLGRKVGWTNINAIVKKH